MWRRRHRSKIQRRSPISSRSPPWSRNSAAPRPPCGLTGPIPIVTTPPPPKFRLAGDTAGFAPAGPCFAQHFGRELAARGGHLLLTEDRHPMIPAVIAHGYGLFSARYGNIYNVRQLKELFEQAVGRRPP